jgi:PAS domain S-box-containing protein
MTSMGEGKVSPAIRSLKVALVLVTSGFLLSLGIHNIALKASVSVLDDGVFWESQSGRVVAKRMDPDGPAAKAGLRKGDVLVAVDQVPVDAGEDVRELLDGATEGEFLTYQVIRLDDQRAFALRIAPLPRGNVALYYFLAAVGIFSLIVGTVVYVRRRGVAGTAHFYLLCVFWFLAYGMSFTGKLNLWDSAFYWMDRVGLLFFPPLFLHFALGFPDRKAFLEKRPWVLPAIYVPSILLLWQSLLGKLLFFAQVPWGAEFYIQTNELIDRLIPFYVATMSLAAFAGFVNSYRNARTITVKKQTKWIVWGTGFGTAPFALLYAVPYLIGVKPSLGLQLSVVPLALIPLSFAYAIVKYRLMDVEVLFKRGVVYTLASVTVVGLYLAIFLLGTNYLLGDTHTMVIAVLATMVVVLVFTPLKSRIQVEIDRLFYRERYNYRRALLAFSQDLNADLDLDHLSQRLVERIRDTFEVEKVSLLVPVENSSFMVLAGLGLSETEWHTTRIEPDSPLLSQLAGGKPVYHDWIERSGHRVLPEHEEFRADGFQYAIPCVAQGKVVGVLLLGRRWDQSALSSDDLELLQTLSGQAATALENASLYRSLERKAEQFEQLKEHSENTIESLDAGILVLDLEGKVVRWNRALERLYGVLRVEALGRTIKELFPASFEDVLVTSMGEAWWTQAENTGVSRLNLESRRGETKVVKLRLAPFVSDSGETQGTIVIFEDITERVELETQLRLREKMASLGVLAAGVAHEVNTPLTGISSFTQMLLGQTGKTDPRSRLLEKIERQTERASKIVNNLLNFARQGRSSFVPVDLNEGVRDVLSLLEHQLTRARVKVRLELSDDLPRVLGDENKLQQVFLNLFLNAQDAMPSGGWLTVKTLRQGTQVVVEISDTGQGIGKEDIKRIYDPFFTTKGAGSSGTGLGLSITYGIIQEHSGHISVDSVVSQGTRFEIKLPAAAFEEAEAARAKVAGGSTREEVD